MKTIKYILISFFSLLFLSCNESKFLEEKPLDFYSPENAMITKAHFETSLNYLYNRVRHMQWGLVNDTRYAWHYGTDFAFNATDYHTPAKLNDYTNVMVPTFSVVSDIWNVLYEIVFNSNVILDRLGETDQITDSDKALIRGEALFFRGYAYQMLAHLFGGVPLVLEEVTTPNRDYVRATREAVYSQIRTDLETAIPLMDNIENVKDGKVSKQVAQHLLTETYISLGMYAEAVQMATHVIEHGALELMSGRFGSRMDEEGDVYWDLFRHNNQNRGSGNTESLWVLQFDYLNAGSSASRDAGFAILPFYGNITITENDAQGNPVTASAFVGNTSEKGGRGVGWMQPTSYFFYELWGDDFDNDIRNSSYNIVRDLVIDNPDSPAFTKWLVADGYADQLDGIRYWFPMLTKGVRVGNVPTEFYQTDANGEPLLTALGEHLVQNGANSGYKDEYMYRLADTYLLRAEAYIHAGNPTAAAADINVLRTRANASPVQPSQVDIDYLLDERMRELYYEELRMVTLTRMGKLVDRNRKYNPKTGVSISDYHNLWPIPYSEIERNVYAVLEQNPGY